MRSSLKKFNTRAFSKGRNPRPYGRVTWSYSPSVSVDTSPGLSRLKPNKTELFKSRYEINKCPSEHSREFISNVTAIGSNY